jgi:hypothetical protein
MSNISNHSLDTDDKQSYYSPAVYDEHALPGPGLTRPVTPDHISVASNDSDKENNSSYDDPYDDPYSPHGLAFTWSHARAAVKLWKENDRHWPMGLAPFSSEIFWTAHLPSTPEHSNDIDEHDTTNYARLHGALRAYREELAPHTVEHKLAPVAEDEEDGRAEEEERGRIILEEIGIPGPYVDSPEQGDNGQVVDKDDERMMAHGWVKYDPFAKESTRVDYEEGGVRYTCKWIRYDIKALNPQVEGCQGPVTKIYTRDSTPILAPLQTFLNHGSFGTTPSKSSTLPTLVEPSSTEPSEISETLDWRLTSAVLDIIWENAIGLPNNANALLERKLPLANNSSPLQDIWHTPEVPPELAQPFLPSSPQNFRSQSIEVISHPNLEPCSLLHPLRIAFPQSKLARDLLTRPLPLPIRHYLTGSSCMPYPPQTVTEYARRFPSAGTVKSMVTPKRSVSKPLVSGATPHIPRFSVRTPTSVAQTSVVVSPSVTQTMESYVLN